MVIREIHWNHIRVVFIRAFFRVYFYRFKSRIFLANLGGLPVRIISTLLVVTLILKTVHKSIAKYYILR